MIHKMMDTTAKGRYSMGRPSSFLKNCRNTSNVERRNSQGPKTICHNVTSSTTDNRFSDLKIIKPCFVKLDKICDKQLSRFLAKKVYSNKVESNARGLEMHSQHSLEMINNPINKNLEPCGNIDVNANVNNIDPEFLATEDHLDLLMAREMCSSHHLTEKRLNGIVKCESAKGIIESNLNPVVLLKRLSPQLISKAINGKLKMESQESKQRRKRKISQLQKMAVTNNDKRTISRNKENIPRPKKRSNGKINESDDEEEFYGFEKQTKNRQRIKKMKEALKTLNAQSLEKERHRILKMKEPLKKFRPRPSGKENRRTAVLNRDIESLMRHKAPFKAVNSVKAESNTDEDYIIFKNSTTENDYQSSLGFRANNMNIRNKMKMVHRNNTQFNDAGADGAALKRLELLKLFKKREKLLISKMVRDQGKIIVSKTGELSNEDKFWDEPLNYYSGKYYIKKTGRRIPLWAEESIANLIFESQEQIPTDIIVGYFQDHDLSDPTIIAEFLEIAFLEKDDMAIKAR